MERGELRPDGSLKIATVEGNDELSTATSRSDDSRPHLHQLKLTVPVALVGAKLLGFDQQTVVTDSSAEGVYEFSFHVLIAQARRGRGILVPVSRRAHCRSSSQRRPFLFQVKPFGVGAVRCHISFSPRTRSIPHLSLMLRVRLTGSCDYRCVMRN